MSKFKDQMRDWYSHPEIDTSTNIKRDRNFNRHMIEPCSMIAIVGPTGCGKSTSILEFLSRKRDCWYRIILFSGSTTDEPLVRLLKSKIPGIECIDNTDQLPELSDMDAEDKTHEKLFIADDVANLTKKQYSTLQKWYCSARKYGFTVVALVQNYTDLPIQIRRNVMYFFLFRLRDLNTINQILRNHNVSGKEKEAIKRAYFEATAEKKNFFLLDLKPESQAPYRHNFTDILNV